MAGPLLQVDAFELVVETPTPKKGQRTIPAGGESADAEQAQAHSGELLFHRAPALTLQLAHCTSTPADHWALLPAGNENVEHNNRPHGSAAKMRPMSLGLSRRSSMVALPPVLGSARKAARASHLRPSTVWAEPR